MCQLLGRCGVLVSSALVVGTGIPKYDYSQLANSASAEKVFLDNCIADRQSRQTKIQAGNLDFKKESVYSAATRKPEESTALSVLWCLGRHGVVQVGMDLFMGDGCGTSLALANGMATATEDDALHLQMPRLLPRVTRAHRPFSGRRMITFEVYSKAVQDALIRCLAIHRPAYMVVSKNGSLVRSIAQPHSDNTGSHLKLTIAEGMPVHYPNHGDIRGDDPNGTPIWGVYDIHLFTNAWERRSPLRSLCAAMKGIDLVALGGYGLMTYEWLTIERTCRPRWVVLFHVNLPFHPGWIRERLLASGGWVEVTTGTDRTGPLPVVGEMWSIRKWTVLMRDDYVAPMVEYRRQDMP